VDLGLNDRVAVVCGASQGMGRAIAAGLAAEGARVLLVARSAERLAQAERAIAAQVPGASLATVALDLTVADSAAAVVEAAQQRWGRLDVLVTNTGGPPPGQPLELDDDKFLLAYEQNFMNVVRLCRHAVPAMRAHGYGRVINVLALSVRQIEDNLVLSSTSRLGVVAVCAVSGRAGGRRWHHREQRTARLHPHRAPRSRCRRCRHGISGAIRPATSRAARPAGADEAPWPAAGNGRPTWRFWPPCGRGS